mgnify:CR=1 FL=1
MTENKIILEASSFPRVDIDFMNNTHFDELVIVQELGQLIAAYQQKDEPSDIETQQVTKELLDWIEHSRAHFYRENRLMTEVEFPMVQVHYQEHERVLEEMLEVANSWEKTNDIEPLVDYVFFAWPTWFNAHVNTMDLMTAQFAVMNGFSPNSAPSLDEDS